LPELAAIDSLMWRQPDSALAVLQQFVANHETDSLDVFNGHYCQLLISELLYKNYYDQTNREELLKAMAYFDSLCNCTGVARNSSTIAFLDARAHYINGVGYYERDSVVEACKEYLKALEVMEGHFEEKELVEHKAQFVALACTHLTDLFSDQYLHEQAIYFGKESLVYYNKYDAFKSHVAWVLNAIGSHYDMMNNYDSADYYYNEGLIILPDTNSLIFRDLATHLAFLNYQKDKTMKISLCQLHNLINQSQSKKESLSRYAIIGDIFYQEKQFDSAAFYLSKVFHNSQSVDSKKQAAEWLVEICKAQGKDFEAHEYADFLVPFANLNENNSHLKSQLAELCNEYGQSRQDRKNLRQQDKALWKNVHIISGVFLTVMLCFLSYLFIRMRSREAEHDEKTKPEAITKPTEAQSFSFAESYADEPICKHILAVCNDKKNPIKSTVPYSAYSGISLDNTQMAELKNAAYHHYGILFEKLGKEHPELKGKDYQYCFLCLLGMDNVQIAALLQKSNSTIWDREKRLQKILGSNDKIAIILHGMITHS
jgi:tetratricopeptide (TPR) repeat protein